MAFPAGWTVLPPLVDGQTAEAYAISTDGSTAVGYANDADGDERAALWTVDGITDLGWLPGVSAFGYAEAHAVNADGTVVVGEGDDSDGNTRAWMWTLADGMVSLGVTGDYTQSSAYDVSSDGSVVVGSLFGGSGPNAGFMWSEGDGFTVITDGVATMAASGVSPDGTQVFGQRGGDPGSFSWTAGGGLVTHAVTIPSAGSGISFGRISDDGAAILVGSYIPVSSDIGFRYDLLPDDVFHELPAPDVSATEWSAGQSTLDGSYVVGEWDDGSSLGRLAIWHNLTDVTSIDAPHGYTLRTVSPFAGRGITSTGPAVVGSIDHSVSSGGNGQNPAHFHPTFPPPSFDEQAAFLVAGPSTMFPGNVTTGVVSFWMHGTNLFTSFQHSFNCQFDEIPLDPAQYWSWAFGIDNFGNMDVVAFSQNSPGTSTQFRAHGTAPGGVFPTDCAVNVLIAFDFTHATQRVQVWVNEVEWPMTIEANSINGPPHFTTVTNTTLAFGNGVSIQEGWLADLWVGLTPSYVDLSTASNRRYFINADLSPVDPQVSHPYDVTPNLFLHLGDDEDISFFFINQGSGSSPFSVQSGAVTADGDPCVTTSVITTAFVYALSVVATPATVADLWFGATQGFVDLRFTSERRKFIGEDGSTAYLGTNGERPFEVSPPVFLTLGAAQAASHFADNLGTGTSFAISGGTLALAGSAPPAGSYTVPADVPPNTPQGADPQIMLSVSDNGGRTFTLQQKWRSMGKLGEYLKRLRWLKLGQFRERQIRLEVTDPVRRNLIGFYIDVTPGLE